MNKILTRAEEAIMQTLWQLQKAGLREIVENMAYPKPHSNTVATILKILAEKGFVTIEPIGRMNFYSPAITKEEYSDRRITGIAEAYFDGSYNKIISYMAESKKVNISDLELLIAQLKNKE